MLYRYLRNIPTFNNKVVFYSGHPQIYFVNGYNFVTGGAGLATNALRFNADTTANCVAMISAAPSSFSSNNVVIWQVPPSSDPNPTPDVVDLASARLGSALGGAFVKISPDETKVVAGFAGTNFSATANPTTAQVLLYANTGSGWNYASTKTGLSIGAAASAWNSDSTTFAYVSNNALSVSLVSSTTFATPYTLAAIVKNITEMCWMGNDLLVCHGAGSAYENTSITVYRWNGSSLTSMGNTGPSFFLPHFETIGNDLYYLNANGGFGTLSYDSNTAALTTVFTSNTPTGVTSFSSSSGQFIPHIALYSNKGQGRAFTVTQNDVSATASSFQEALFSTGNAVARIGSEGVPIQFAHLTNTVTWAGGTNDRIIVCNGTVMTSIDPTNYG